jgi:hypothetical protein
MDIVVRFSLCPNQQFSSSQVSSWEQLKCLKWHVSIVYGHWPIWKRSHNSCLSIGSSTASHWILFVRTNVPVFFTANARVTCSSPIFFIQASLDDRPPTTWDCSSREQGFRRITPTGTLKSVAISSLVTRSGKFVTWMTYGRSWDTQSSAKTKQTYHRLG